MGPEPQTRSGAGSELVAEIAGNFGEVRLRVTGASMMPAVWPGDAIKVRRCDAGEPEPGRIVLYQRDGTLVAHRLIRVEGDLLVTRGDALVKEDPPVEKTEVLGEVVCILRSGRLIFPERSLCMRMGSAIVRRSGFCLRMTLRVAHVMRMIRTTELSWSS